MSLPKIIIKRPVQPPAPPAEPTPSNSPPQEEEEEEDEEQEDADAPMDVSSEPASEVEPEDLPPVEPVKRPRGRPRGRARGAAPSSPSTRGRGRPRGRPRGRGRGSMTIRLPRRIDEDGTEVTDQDAGGDDAVLDYQIPKERPPQIKTVHGVDYVIQGDELIIEDDPKGEEKIDKWGNLLGGRVFKANTFILPNRHPQRVYMLAIDAARSSGFRDSLYYFRRNPLTHKLNATQSEKDYLIEQGKLGSHLKTRSVTLITARSVFKLHGAKTVRDGRWITDDYYEDKVLAEITEKGLKPGDPVGELPDPNASTAAKDDAAQSGSKGERAGAAKGIYQAGGPTTIFAGSGWGPFSDGPLNAVRKSLLSRDGLTEENYMHQAALGTLEASEQWAQRRRKSLANQSKSTAQTVEPRPAERAESSQPPSYSTKPAPEEHPLGLYEAHTGITLYPVSTQPTRTRWELAPDYRDKYILGGTKTGSSAWGLAWIDHVMEPVKDSGRDVLEKEQFASVALRKDTSQS